MPSRPPSPLKKSIKKFLSPSKSKPAPALSLQGGGEHNNWTYNGSSSSTYSSSSDNGTGWNVVEPPTPTSVADKENRGAKDVVDHVMGQTSSKLSKRNTKSTSVLNNKSQNQDLDHEFEELMVFYKYVTVDLEFPLDSDRVEV
jgi:hypothetical protein